MTKEMLKTGSNTQRLDRIAEIIEAVERRCEAVDGPAVDGLWDVTPTKQGITGEELRLIYVLAKRRKAGVQ